MLTQRHCLRVLIVFLAGFCGFCLICLSVYAQPAQPRLPQAIQDTDRLLVRLIPARQGVIQPLVTLDRVSLGDYLEYWLDTGDFVDVNDVASAEYQERFQIYNPRRLPLTGNGVLWLRFVLQATPAGAEQQHLLLELGPNVPGSPVLFTPRVTERGLEWNETDSVNGRIRLPETSTVPVVCFLRLEGVPGMWFSPVVRKLDAASTTPLPVNWHLVGLVTLGTIFVMCLLQCMAGPGQWRLWAVLYLAAVLAQSWGGTPAPGAAYTAKTVAGTCCGGLALMLWPHVGRHLLNCRSRHHGLDASFILLCLPGAALALLPLVPQLQWMTRYTELWPLAMLIFVPSTIWACLCGIRSSVKYLLGTFIPPLAVAAAILGTRSSIEAELLAALPMLGLTLGALCLLALVHDAPRAEHAPAAPNLADLLNPLEDDMRLNMDDSKLVELCNPLAENEATAALSAPLAAIAADLENLAADTRLDEEKRQQLEAAINKLKELSTPSANLSGAIEKTEESVSADNEAVSDAAPDTADNREGNSDSDMSARMSVFDGLFEDRSSGKKDGAMTLSQAFPTDREEAAVATAPEKEHVTSGRSRLDGMPPLSMDAPNTKNTAAVHGTAEAELKIPSTPPVLNMGTPVSPDLGDKENPLHPAPQPLLTTQERSALMIALAMAGKALKAGDMRTVQRAAGTLEARSEGHTSLKRLASLMGRAAASGDKGAVRDLLFEFCDAVDRRTGKSV